jgi:hypothetical protein
MKDDKVQVCNPTILEYILGYMSIGIFILHCYYKIQSKQLIFMLNPCHVLNLIQGYLLINKNETRQRLVYIGVMNTLFSPWIAIAFPVTCGLTGFLEVPMFWVEHYLAALVNPLVLSLSGRYYTQNTISVKYHIFSHVVFGIYQRAFLWPVSQLTHTNLNFTLCACKSDPFVPILGKWYYVFSEAYIYVGGEIFHRLIKVIIKFILLNIKGLMLKEIKD